MRLIRVDIDGLKGSSRSQPLTGLDLLVGPNGSGKSTVLQAVGIALLGYASRDDRRPSAVLRLASKPAGLAVGLETEAGFRFSRSFLREQKRSKDGAVTVSDRQAFDLSPSRGEKTQAAVEARIASECGAFPVALDVAEFLSLTPAQRRAFCLGLLGQQAAAGPDRDWAADYLRERLLTEVRRRNDPAGYGALDGMIAGCVAEWRTGMEAQDGLRAMDDWARGNATAVSRRARDAAGAVREMAALKSRGAETDRDLAANEAEVGTLREDLVTCERDLATARERTRSVRERALRIEGLRAREASLATECEGPLDLSGPEARIAAGRAAVRQVLAPRDFGPEVAAVDKTLDELAGQRIRVGDALAAARATLAQAEATRAAIGEGRSVCVIHQMIGCPKDWKTPSEYFAKAASEGAEATRTLTAQLAEIDRSVASAHGKRREIHEQQVAEERERTATISSNGKAARDISAAEAEIVRLQTARAEAERRLAQVRADIESETALADAPGTAVLPVETMELQAQGIRSRITELERSIAAQRATRDAVRTQLAAMGDATQAESEAAGAKALVDAVGPQGLGGELLRSGVGPLAEDVTANLRAMGLPHEAVFSMSGVRGSEVFDLQWRTPAGEVRGIEALSTGERLLLVAALLTAFIGRANPRCKLLTLDNIECLDGPNLGRALGGLKALRDAGRLDNVLLAGVVPPEGVLCAESLGWAVVDMRSVAAVVPA